MGLFYVLFKKKRGGYQRVSQRLITFVNREAADEWWRMISTPCSIHAGHVKRISPQLYVQIAQRDVFSSFNDDDESAVARHFYERMFFTCAVQDPDLNTTPIFLQNDVTDHIRGRWYFIRSKANPSSHWYLRTSGTCAVCASADCNAVHVSSDYRTRFCVRVRDQAVPENFVMIGRDEISVAAPRGYILYIDDTGDLKAKKGDQGESDLLFGDLSNRFITRAERQVSGEVWEYVESVERDVGEPWELA